MAFLAGLPAAAAAASEALPAILSAGSIAKGLFNKFVPNIKKSAGMFFKGHHKSPAHFLSKITKLRPRHILSAVKSVGSGLRDVGQIAGIAEGVLGKGGNISAIKNLAEKGADTVDHHHQILEDLNGGVKNVVREYF